VYTAVTARPASAGADIGPIEQHRSFFARIELAFDDTGADEVERRYTPESARAA